MTLTTRIQGFRPRHSLWQVWTDFLLLGATSIANATDLRPAVREAREAEYMRTIGRYDAQEALSFSQAIAALTLDLEVSPRDVLGQTYMELGLGNKWAGQFFTPHAICDLMAATTMGGEVRDKVERNGFITVQDPAIGGGAMVIGVFNAMRSVSLNPQTQLHVTGIDVDIKSVHMSFLQLSLLGIPAVIVHGNTLLAEEWSHWYTPMHILNGWNTKLRGRHERAEPPPSWVEPGLNRSGPLREPARCLLTPRAATSRPDDSVSPLVL